jgi:leucyl/phenylalanyl-tRNA---protein transferase
LPVYQIPDEHLIFPYPWNANSDGLLGIGGDLQPQRLILAYENGIFPWYSAGEPIQWWCLTPRLVLFPEQLRISKSMKSVLKHSGFSFTMDRDFLTVMLQCKTINREKQTGSWIHQDIMDAFLKLHQMGIAHSVAVWQKNELVGGLYGLAIGKMFCGESMFAKTSNASKYALIQLCSELINRKFNFIDCQQDTAHLRTMGAQLIEKERFYKMLEENKNYPVLKESWNGK